MPKISSELLRKKKALVNQLDLEFEMWRPHFQLIAQYLLPRRYVWLHNSAAPIALGALENKRLTHNEFILDPTATIAARVLAAGLMNGITSPARPWFRINLAGVGKKERRLPREIQMWLENSTERMHMVLAASNFYSALAIYYLELVGFGTANMLCYEDFDQVVRFYNTPMGEYRLIQDNRREVCGMARAFNLKLMQLVEEFGVENLSPQLQARVKEGGAALLETYRIVHLIEKNTAGEGAFPRQFQYREYFWEAACTDGSILRVAGYREKSFFASRWECLGNDTYGTSPTMDAIPEIRQLQHQTKTKAVAMDKMVRPPIVADISLQAQPTAFLPGGVSYVPGSSTFGAKPIFTVNPPLNDMTMDIMKIQDRIKEIYYNNLFRNVSNLQTVRSAIEIAERKAEDMVLLGSVIERFESEALDPILKRVFAIMLRKDLFLDLPQGLTPDTIEIEYVSILADAQRAAATGPIERYMQVVGNLASIAPDALRIPDFQEMLREYASRLNVPAGVNKPEEQVQAELEAEQEQLAEQQGALVGSELSNAARNLSQTDLGGGQNAIQALLGG